MGIAALSVDPEERSRSLARQLDLPFPLLCDPARAVVEAWGLLNRREKGGIAYPATFVLGRDRKILFRSLDGTMARVQLDRLFAFLHRGAAATAPAEPARSVIFPRVRDLLRVAANVFRYGLRSPRG